MGSIVNYFKVLSIRMKKYSKATSLLTLLSVIMFFCLMLVYTLDYFNYTATAQKYDYIQSIMEKATSDSLTLNEENIQAITNDIKVEYGDDLVRLEKDLRDVNRISPLTNIFYNQIKDVTLYNIGGVNGEDDNDDPFIMAKNQQNEWVIWIDNSKNCASKLGETRTIDEEVMKHFNTYLAQQALDDIVNQKDGFKIWSFVPVEKSFAWYNELSTIKYLDETELRRIFFKYNGDIRIFQTLEIVSATTYIYKETDLLGNSLVDQTGHTNKNYQLIMVQGYNVLDVINSNPQYQQTIENFDNSIEKTYRLFEFVIGVLSVFTVVIFVVMAHKHNTQPPLTLCKGCDTHTAK